jgi:agmatine deiminase
VSSTGRPVNPRLPAEWEPHAATWLIWPHNPKDWPGKFTPIPWVYAEIVRHLSESEPVNILVSSERAEKSIRRVLGRAGADLSAVSFVEIATNRSWARDSFPAFVHEGAENSTAMVDFRFTGWAKYPDHANDDGIPERIEHHTGMARYTATHLRRHVVLEGGAIDCNGLGTLLTTEECLLDQEVQSRNPGFTRKDYEQLFRDWLGIDTVIWLPGGIQGDDTHGHVDDVCRFVSPDTVVLCSEPDPKDGNRAFSRRTGRFSTAFGSATPRCRSSTCPCLPRFFSKGSGSRQATPTSTSRTPASSFPRSMTPTTASHSPSSPTAFREEPSGAFMPWIWCGGLVPCTA